MKQIVALMCGLLFLLAPVALIAQSEGGSDQATNVPLGVEQRGGKLVFESKDGAFKWWFDSRIQLDFAKYFEDKNPLSDGSIIRRATLAFKTTLWNDWQAELDLDFQENALDARDMWIKYTVPNMGLAFQVGNFKEPFGLEELNSSRLLTFLERASVSNAIPLGRRMGLDVRYWNTLGQATVGVFGHDIGTRINKGTEDEGYDFVGRVSVAPVNTHGRNLHFGLAAAYKTPDATIDYPANALEVKARNETYVFDPKPLHSGTISNINYWTRYGIEAMGVYGPFYVQSEVMTMQIKRWYGNPTAHFWGGYATATWMVTGETRVYYVDEGEVGAVEAPKSSWGALELAARLSTLDLNDGTAGFHGGSAVQLMLGVNYYPNVNFKIQLNYSVVNNDDFATSNGKMKGNDDYSFFQVRFQASI